MLPIHEHCFTELNICERVLSESCGDPLRPARTVGAFARNSFDFWFGRGWYAASFWRDAVNSMAEEV